MPWPAGVPRSEETRKKIGAAQAGRRHSSHRFKMRTCRVCSKQFQGNGSRHWYCSPECKATARYEFKSGIAQTEYERLLAAQDGACAICRQTDIKGNRNHVRFFLDHDHKTGRRRGLLCFSCNRAIGLLGDDPDRLLRAAAYVAG